MSFKSILGVGYGGLQSYTVMVSCEKLWSFGHNHIKNFDVRNKPKVVKKEWLKKRQGFRSYGVT